MPTVQFTFRVNDVLTNADTSALLSDPTATFGIKRNDTGAVVVADGTALTLYSDPGVYRHTFTAPASGLTYSAYAEFVHAGVTYYAEKEFTDSDAGESVVVSGTFFNSVTSARTFGGPFNADVYFDKDGTEDATKIAAAWQQALERTHSDIRLAWKYRLAQEDIAYTSAIALTPLFVTDPDEEFWLAETADWGTIIRGYEGRGTVDVGESIDGKMAELRARYEERLRQIREGEVLFTAQADAGITADSQEPGEWSMVEIDRGIECTEDEYSA